MGREVLGEELAVPVILAPVGNQQSIHADGEVATARAAKAAGLVCVAVPNRVTAGQDFDAASLVVDSLERLTIPTLASLLP